MQLRMIVCISVLVLGCSLIHAECHLGWDPAPPRCEAGIYKSLFKQGASFRLKSLLQERSKQSLQQRL